MAVFGSVPTLLEAEQLELSAALFKGVFNKPALTQFHDIRTGIKGQTRIPILAAYNGLLGSIKTACDITPATGNMPITEKTWTPKFISDRVTQCYEPLMGSYIQWLMANGLGKENINNAAYWANFIVSMLQDAMMESLYLKAWLGDTALVAVTGNSVASGDVKYFTPIDGFWKQLIAIVTADTTKRVTITKNTAATNALQKFDSTDTTNQVVTGYFDSAFFRDADFRLRSLPVSELVIISTASISDQYIRERKAFTNIDLSYSRIENGMNVVQWNGIDVVEFNFLDRMLATYFQVTASSNTSTVNPHRFVLTTKKNLMIATEQESNFSELTTNYDTYHKLWYADFAHMLDAKVGLDNMVVVGY